LIAAFAAQFGNCYTKLDYEDTYVWLGGFVGQVYLKCRPLDHHCIGDISSVTANKQKEVDKAAGAARARRDF